MFRAFLLTILCISSLLPVFALAQVSSSSNPSTTGNFTISWPSGKGSVTVSEKVGNNSPVTVYSGSANQYSVSGKPNGTYTYEAFDLDGFCHPFIGCIPSSLGNVTVTVSLIVAPSIPGGLTAPSTAADGNYTVSWSASTGTVTSYQLQESQNGGSWNTVQTSTTRNRTFNKSPNNYYDYRVRACNQSQCSPYTGSTRVSIPAQNTGAPFPSAFSQPTHNPAVGALAGEHKVEQNGAAGYTIPIQISGGRAGLQPGLSISYNSSGGNSALGLGWTLDGLSAIQRCPTNILRGEEPSPVDYSPNDRYCLDGQRLVLISGSFYGADGAEYRKENDDGTKIISYSRTGYFSAGYFKVWAPNGTIKEYGNSSDSKVLGNGLNEAATWALNRVEDRYSNYMTLTYEQPASSGNYRPSRIDYTGNSNDSASPTNSVQFVYSENRSDPETHYLGGVSSSMNWLMSRIEVYSSSTKLREYKFSYSNLDQAPHTSTLDSVELCSGSTCMIPTDINWSSEDHGHHAISTWFTANSGGITSWATDGQREDYIDVNGDGLPDRIWNPNGGVEGYYVAINTGNGFSSPSRWIAPTVYVNGNVVTHSDSKEWYIDIDSDGLDDRVWEPSGANNRIYWLRNTGSSFVSPKILFQQSYNISGSPSIVSRAREDRESFQDMDKDGLVDRIWVPENSHHTYVMFNQGNGNFSAPEKWLDANIQSNTNVNIKSYSQFGKYEYFQDMNLDGFPDKVWMPDGTHDLYVALNNGSGFSFISKWLDRNNSPVYVFGDDGKKQQLLDINGDGLADWVWLPYAAPTSYSGDYFVALNNGQSFENPTIWIDNSSFSYSSKAANPKWEQYVDINGDGLADRFWMPEGRSDYYVAYNTGSDFDTPVIWQTSNAGGVGASSSQGKHERMLDLNGDGFTDRVWNPGNDNYYVALTKPNYRRVESIVAGNAGSEAGHTTSFYYKPATDSSVHTRSQISSAYPINPDSSSRPLVHRVTTTNGIGGVLTTDYHYNDAKAHVGGYGSLGFASMTTLNADNGISTTTHFNQDVNTNVQGTVNRVTTQFNGITLSDTENSWVNIAVGSGESARSRMELRSTDMVKRDLNGAFMSDERNTYQYNSNGSPSITTTELYNASNTLVRRKVTTNSFHSFNSSTKLLPVANKTRVDVTVTGKPTLSSVTSWTYHATTGKKLKDQILHPDTESVLSETEYHDFDTFGNNRKTTVRGSDFSDRTSSVTYDSTGRYVVSSTNSLGHTKQSTYYSNNSINAGRVNTTTDENGIQTKFYYDVFGRVTRKTDAYGTSNPVNTYTSFQWCDDITDAMICRHVVSDSRQIYRITTSTDGGAGKHVYVDKLGREVKSSTQSIDGRFVHVVNHYDALGRNYKVCDPFYDGTAPSDIIVTEVEHDALGRVIKSTEHNGIVNTVTFNGLERISTNDVNGEAQTKTEYRDEMNNIVSVVDNIGNSATYDFDSLGNVVSVSDSESNTTTIKYDALGRKTEMDDLDKGLWRYTYNGLGQLITQTNARGETSCMIYDTLGRMTRRYDNYYGTLDRDLGASAQAKNNCANPGTSTYNYWTYDSASGKSLGKLYRSGSSDGNYLSTNYYDGTYGRLTRTDERIDGRTYQTDSSYDSLHRVDVVTYPGVYNRLRVRNIYNDLGFAVETENADNASETYYSLVSVDPQGNPLEEIFGNGVTTTREFEPVTNRIKTIESWSPIDGFAPSIQELDFTFDVAGNLTARNDYIQNISETFGYDDLNRLISTSADFGNGDVRNTSVVYDDIGNIVSKTGVGTYSYGGTCNGRVAGPHAVTSITSPKSTNYCYDANGNMTQGDGRTIQYSSFDKPTHIQQGSNTTAISYNPDRNRYKRVDNVGSNSTSYNYVGGIYEHVEFSSGDVEQRNFVGGSAIVTYTRKANASTSSKTRYLHKDHLGSITVITDNAGNVVEEFSFDPWGKRRAANLSELTSILGAWHTLNSYEKANLTISASLLASTTTNQGFTGHEQLDGVGLIHMNGRVYDAEIGRFISADPHVQDITNMQSLNRYSYVQNNPLSYTDPSGYFLKKIFKKFVKHLKRMHKAAMSVLKAIGKVINAVPGLSTVVGLVISFYCPPCGALYFQYLTLLNMAISLANGVPPGAVLTNAAVAYVTGGVGAGIGNLVGNQVVGSMIASGIAAKASGGKFIDGMKSAAIGAAAGAAAKFAGDKIVQGLASMGETKADATPAASSGTEEVNTGTPGTGSTEDRAALQKSIDALSADGTLSPNRSFESADAAAMEVLNATAGLSKQYGLEVAGSIWESEDGWHYTTPKIGDVGSASLTTSFIGYHTHPNGSFKFSNQFRSHTGGAGDAGWVASSNKSLYLGVQIGGNVSIGVCSPGSCPQFGRLGTSPSRVLQ